MPTTATTIQELREKADAYEAEAWAAMNADNETAAQTAFRKAAWCRRMADDLEAEDTAARRHDGEARLPAGRRRARVVSTTPMLTAEHKVQLSALKTSKGNRLATAARKAGYSLRGLAKEVGVSSGLMTLAYNGDRAMPLAAAEKIQKLTGFPVTSWKRIS